MENQETLRNQVRRRCMLQTEIAKEIGITNIYFNSWLKGHRDIGEESITKIINWLKDEKNELRPSQNGYGRNN